MTGRLPKVAAAAVLAGTLAFSAAAPLAAQTTKSSGETMPKVGDVAPDFTLTYIDSKGEEKQVKLSDYRGKKNVVVAFYIFAFTGG